MKKLMEIFVYTIFLPAIMAGYALAFAIIALLDYCHFLVDTIKEIYEPGPKVDIIDKAFYDNN